MKHCKLAALICVVFLLCMTISKPQNNSRAKREFQRIERDPATGLYKVIPDVNQIPPSPQPRKDPQQKFEQSLALQKRIDVQNTEMRKLAVAQQRIRKELLQKQSAQTPTLQKIKFLGKETEYYQGKALPRNLRTIKATNAVLSNIRINGKQADTIYAGENYTVSITLASNALTASVNIYVDMNNNGIVDSVDVPVVHNGLIFDNADEDLNPVQGEFEILTETYNQLLTSLIFEVNTSENISTATLTVTDKPSTKIIIGTLSPPLDNAVVSFSSSWPGMYWNRIVIPDSTGKFSVYFDTTANHSVDVFVNTISTFPVGYLPPPDTTIKVKNDTTRLTRSYKQAKEFIEGYVKDQYGNPIKDVQIFAYNECWRCDPFYTITYSDSAGYYKVSVMSGEWSVYTQSPLTTDMYLNNNSYYYIEVSPNQTVSQNFSLTLSNATISGNIKFNTQGVSGIPIQCFRDTVSNFTFSDQSGNYSLKVWKPESVSGSYNVDAIINNSGYFVDTSYNNVPPGETNKNFIIQKIAGGIQGKITDINTGLPIQHAYGYLSGPTFRYFQINDSGYYKVSLRDGIYSISINADYYEYYLESNIAISGSVITKNIAMTRTGSFSGTVTDDSGNPVINATIVARNMSGNYVSGSSSDFQGHYVVGGLQTSNYKAVASAQGFLTQWYDKKTLLDSATIFSVTKGFDTPNINFVLSRGGSISGAVKDKYGEAISNVYLSAIDSAYNLINSTFSDDSGAYVLSGLPSGHFYVTASHSDYFEQYYKNAISIGSATKVPVVIYENTPNINFVLSAGGIITGEVTDKIGTPIPNSEVAVFDSAKYFIQYSWTDEYGRYAIRRLPTGKKLYVTAFHDQYSRRWYDNVLSFDSATPLVLLPDVEKANINFTLLMSGKISGVVKNKTGGTIQDVNINAFHANGNIYWAHSTGNGSYTINNLQAGKYIVSATRYGYVTQWYNQKNTWRQLADTILVEDEKTTSEIDFTLTEGGKITGKVKNTAGEPIPFAFIEVSGKNFSWYSGSSDNLGNYIISGLESGNYSVHAAAADYNEQWFDHRSTAPQADSVSVEFEKTTSNINFDLKAMSVDSVVVKIVVDDLPDSLTFSQSNVPDNYVDYWWGIRFEIFKDTTQPGGGTNDFETELALMHAKMPGDKEFISDPISATQHSLVRWYGNIGNHIRSNVRVWRNPIELNTLYLAAPKSWWEINTIGLSTKFFGNTIYYGASGQVNDKTGVGTGQTTVNDVKGDIAYSFVDFLSVGWKIQIATSVSSNELLPQKYSLDQNYPNPFNPSTTIRYALPRSAHVTLTVHDVLGREIATLVNEEQSAGWKEVRWNAKNHASGMYVVRMQSGGFVETKKLVLMK